jgi:hypothetical protein
VKYTLKLANDEMPFTGAIQAGRLSKPFTLDAKTSTQLFVYLEDDTIVGPIDKNTEAIRGTTKSLETRTGPRTIIKGDSPVPPPPDKPDSGGVKVPVRQEEVVE